jgi:glycosyltransferase involved in cell wall biosynthesis
MKIKKHILFVVENKPAPLDRRVWPEALLAKELGFNVTVISPENERAMGRHVEIDGIEIYRYPKEINSLKKFRFISEYINALVWESFLSLKIFFTKPFHIIHAANPPDHIFIIAIFYKLFGIKFIFDHHDLSPELYRVKFSKGKNIVYKILMICEKFSCKFADAIISTNESYRKIVIQRHGVDPERVFVVRNDPKKKECNFKKAMKKRENGKKILLFLGSINPQDGLDYLLKALYYLVNDLKETNFICNILGGGDTLPPMIQMTNKLKLDNFVDFKGWVTEKNKIKEYLHSSDICIEPAPDNELNRHSTFIKVMEYMAAGKPIVAFDLKETRISTNNSALLVRPGKVDEFAQAIKRLIDEPQLRQKLGSNGRKRIIDKLNWENTSLNLKSAYDLLKI